MPTLLYLHGFLSSPASAKAVATARWLRAHRPDVQFACPALPAEPHSAMAKLQAALADLRGPVGLIGSSLGGFWATYLAEAFDLKAVLINPAVAPHTRFQRLVGEPLQYYHGEHGQGGQSVRLTTDDLQALAEFDVPEVRRARNYWLLLQTGDTTLDYRHALLRYPDSPAEVLPGGSHGFEAFESWLPDVVRFVCPPPEH